MMTRRSLSHPMLYDLVALGLTVLASEDGTIDRKKKCEISFAFFDTSYAGRLKVYCSLSCNVVGGGARLRELLIGLGPPPLVLNSHGGERSLQHPRVVHHGQAFLTKLRFFFLLLLFGLCRTVIVISTPSWHIKCLYKIL